MRWEDVLTLLDSYLEWLAQQMNTDSRHGVYWQQRMAVLMLRRQEVLARIEEEKSEIVETGVSTISDCEGR